MMKKLLFVLFVLFTSCTKFGVETQREYNLKLKDLEIKHAELDYLERLYEVKNEIMFREKIRVIDSLIKATEQ